MTASGIAEFSDSRRVHAPARLDATSGRVLRYLDVEISRVLAIG